jgi:hypothetical protein
MTKLMTYKDLLIATIAAAAFVGAVTVAFGPSRTDVDPAMPAATAANR